MTQAERVLSPAATAGAGPYLAGPPEAKRPNLCCKNLSSLLAASRSAGDSDSSGSTFCMLTLVGGGEGIGYKHNGRCSVYRNNPSEAIGRAGDKSHVHR